MLTKVQLKAGTRVAKQDLKILKKDGCMAITNTKKGTLFFRFENCSFLVISNGSEIFRTDCEKALINFLINDIYIF